MKLRTLLAITAASGLSLGLIAPANATLFVSASVGGAPTGVNYVTFEEIPIGSAGGVSNGVTVSFGANGQAVTGASGGAYAPPYISGSNGTLFGDANPVPHTDASTYLTTGTSSVTLMMPAMEMYFGILWGSVDPYNTLNFYDGATLVGSIIGTDITAGANGDQGVLGTYYVNVNSDVAFNRVEAISSSFAFEFDNVAYNETQVPEPFSLGLLGLGVLGAGLLRRRTSAKQIAA